MRDSVRHNYKQAMWQRVLRVLSFGQHIAGAAAQSTSKVHHGIGAWLGRFANEGQSVGCKVSMHDIPYRVKSERCGEHNELSRLVFGLLHDLESLVRRARVCIQDKVLNLCKREQYVAVQLPNTLWLADENIHPVSEPLHDCAGIKETSF